MSKGNYATMEDLSLQCGTGDGGTTDFTPVCQGGTQLATENLNLLV